MGSAASPLQSPAATPPIPPGASPSTLVGAGAGPGDESASSSPSPQDGLRKAAQMVTMMRDNCATLAQQFPMSSKNFHEADKQLQAAMRQIIANPGIPEPASPSIGG